VRILHFAQFGRDYLRNYRGSFRKMHDEIHRVSAIGKSRLDTVRLKLTLEFPYTAVHDNCFSAPREIPELKQKRFVLHGITVFL